MTIIHRLKISPPLINSSCAWASDGKQLQELYSCEYTGAVTTRTATLNGFAENPGIHTVAFSASSISSVNSYGYSPYPLSQYLSWIEGLLQPSNPKPIIISVTSSKPAELNEMVSAIQQFRSRIGDTQGDSSRIGIELNTSCPNIDYAPPPAYNPDSLLPLLKILGNAYQSDRTLSIGLKLPPYTYSTQFTEIIRVVEELSFNVDGARHNPISFLTCTNTLGSSLLFAEQTPSLQAVGDASLFALPTPLGGLAGEALHALALGNVYTFSNILSKTTDPALKQISIIGVGGVTSAEAAERMKKAGAKVVACATLLGREGVAAFKTISPNAS